MPKYTVDELFQLKPSETLAVDFDAVEFKAVIEKVKQVQALKEEEYISNHGHFNRRRSSHHNIRPKIKHNKPKVTTDEDGWSTFETKADEATTEDGNSDSEKPAPIISKETSRVRPNNKNISSSRPADNSDIISDKQNHGFNTFAALVSDDDDE